MEQIFKSIDDDIRKGYENARLVKISLKNESANTSDTLSNAKFIEEFSRLTGEINSCIVELGDEEGEYVHQEHHWETPEFYADTFSSDIDKHFSKILPMLDRAFELKIEDEDLLTNILDDIESGISGFPEWIGAEYSDFCLGEKGSECILKWAWLNKKSIKDFLQNSKTLFDSRAVTSRFSQIFLKNETENNLKELYKELCSLRENQEWRKNIEDVHSIWHDIYHTSEVVADKKTFLKTSQDMIPQKWEYGIPVYKNYREENDLEKAEHYCEYTVREFFRQNIYGDFCTLINKTIYATHSDKKDSRLVKIFSDWMRLCKQLDMTEKVNAVRIQYCFYLTPDNWNQLLEIFQKNIKHPFISDYLKEWKTYVCRKTLNANYSSISDDNWIGWLVDFALNSDRDEFISKTSAWLNDGIKAADSYDYGLDYQLLLLISVNTLPKTEVMETYPNFKKFIINSKPGSVYNSIPGGNSNLEGITSYLRKSDASALLKTKIIEAWNKNIHKFIPSPKDVYNSDYSGHARWLALAKELNTETYNQFYNNWKTNHFRRINLWRALGKYGITIPKPNYFSKLIAK